MQVRTGLSVPEGYGVSFDDAVEIASQAECDFVEVLFDGRARPERVDATLGAALDDADGVGLVAHLPFTVPVWSPFDAQRRGCLETHRACLDAAAALDAEAAVVHPSHAAMGDAYDEPTIVDGVLESLTELHAYGDRLGVDVCVENVQSGPFTLDGLARVVDGTPAGLVVDTGHARVSGHGDERLAEFVADHRDRIEHVHLNDTRGPSDEHLPLGVGTVDFRSVLGALGPTWTGRLCAEVITGDRRALERSLDRLTTYVAEHRDERDFETDAERRD
ncbi:sugar phosphate isomerase/epimerase [Halorubellus sp. JP-L1]|uniref:sugar phosphate isomerase/epimerase family protein n=1 Tax=Halorubellus sp. JP-L1 TaxID=2715753 RepID=UPI00140A7E3C|nr:sugar phosphate isomerase/epimerase [Halorubellus sp. JP-L1]NHN40890.1 sugar phosphate isomerase/epimerase [Halorubellus sp. JP-L1]